MRITSHKGVPRFAGELRNYKIIGSAKKRCEFRGGEGFAGFQSDPFSARQIGSGDDAGTLGKFGEIFGGDFQREPNTGWFERCDSKHFAGDLEEEVVAPLDLLRDRGKREADFAELLDVHGEFLPCGFLAAYGRRKEAQTQ